MFVKKQMLLQLQEMAMKQIILKRLHLDFIFIFFLDWSLVIGVFELGWETKKFRRYSRLIWYFNFFFFKNSFLQVPLDLVSGQVNILRDWMLLNITLMLMLC